MELCMCSLCGSPNPLAWCYLWPDSELLEAKVVPVCCGSSAQHRAGHHVGGWQELGGGMNGEKCAFLWKKERGEQQLPVSVHCVRSHHSSTCNIRITYSMGLSLPSVAGFGGRS